MKLGLAHAAKQCGDVFGKSFIEPAGQPFLEFLLLRRGQRFELQAHQAAMATPDHLGFGE